MSKINKLQINASFDTLTSSKSFASWKPTTVKGRKIKLPIIASGDPKGNNRPASVNNPTNWVDLSTASLYIEQSNPTRKIGLGVKLGEVTNLSGKSYVLVGVDFDGVLKKKRDMDSIDPDALEVISCLEMTYTEFSPSGLGLHSYFLMSKTEVMRLKADLKRDYHSDLNPDNFGPNLGGHKEIKFISKNKYFTVTGDNIYGLPEVKLTVDVDPDVDPEEEVILSPATEIHTLFAHNVLEALIAANKWSESPEALQGLSQQVLDIASTNREPGQKPLPTDLSGSAYGFRVCAHIGAHNDVETLEDAIDIMETMLDGFSIYEAPGLLEDDGFTLQNPVSLMTNVTQYLMGCEWMVNNYQVDERQAERAWRNGGGEARKSKLGRYAPANIATLDDFDNISEDITETTLHTSDGSEVSSLIRPLMKIPVNDVHEANDTTINKFNKDYAVLLDDKTHMLVHFNKNYINKPADVRNERLPEKDRPNVTQLTVQNAHKSRRFRLTPLSAASPYLTDKGITTTGLNKSGETVPISAVNWFKQNQSSIRVYQEVMDGVLIPGVDFATQHAGNVLNTCPSLPLTPIEGDWSNTEEFILNGLCRGVKRDYNILMDFLTHMMQNPFSKVLWGVAIVGAKGTGKDTLGWMINYILGDYRCVQLDGSSIFAKFNASIADKTFIHVEEIAIPALNPAAHHESMSKWKSMMTSEKTSIEGKGVDMIKSPSYARHYYTANEPEFLPLEAGDRRLFVLQSSNRYEMITDDDRVRGGKYFETLREKFITGEASAFMHRLLDPEKYPKNLPITAPSTEYKKSISVMQSIPDRICNSVFERSDNLLSRTNIGADEYISCPASQFGLYLSKVDPASAQSLLRTKLDKLISMVNTGLRTTIKPGGDDADDLVCISISDILRRRSEIIDEPATVSQMMVLNTAGSPEDIF